MDKYHITPRKYRPKTFSEVIGQDATTKTLKNAIRTGHLSHAYLFSGTRGTGKTTLARIFAKALNCIERQGEEPCNVCTSCLEISQGASLDVIEIDGASNRGIEDIRQITENAGYATASGKNRIYIIDEVHMLTKEAFNALLKTLEEPPQNVKFFFATTEPHKVLQTILSRCQRFDLKRIQDSAIVSSLKNIADAESISIEDKALELIAHLSEGSLRDAQSLFDQMVCLGEQPITASLVQETLGLPSESLLKEVEAALLSGNIGEAKPLTDKLYASGKDLTAFLETLASYFLGKTPFSRGQVLDSLNLITTALSDIYKIPFKKIHIEILLTSLIANLHKPSIHTLVERLEALQQKAPTPSVPPQEKVEPQPIPPPAPAPVVQKNDYDRLLQFTAVELNGSILK
ncbi:MAG: DNA polymerase III subunit gamma/tau [Simkaniaceae bacterium]|nr:DNA polymerase III subunit gamma/tau [Simkaniaceae bacterium]